jgi:hypothetical protein
MKVTINGFIIAKQDKWTPAPEFVFREYDSSKYQCEGECLVMVKPHTVEFDVPDDFDMRPGMVENLEREKEKITAQFQARVTQINAQIQSLLAIEA